MGSAEQARRYKDESKDVLLREGEGPLVARRQRYAIGFNAIFFSITAAAFSAFFLRLNTFCM